MLNHNILDHVALCHAHTGLSAVTGKKSVLQTVPSRIVITSTFVLCVHSILRLQMFITRQFIVLTTSTKAETGHLLWGSHKLHHYSPKAASPHYHFQDCPADSKHVAQIYQYYYDYLYTPPTLPNTPILNCVCIHNYIIIVLAHVLNVPH